MDPIAIGGIALACVAFLGLMYKKSGNLNQPDTSFGAEYASHVGSGGTRRKRGLRKSRKNK
jgi:hypothetical protein